MPSTSSTGILRRLTTAKMLGLIIGLIAFFVLPSFWAEVPPMLRWGVLLWYITFGGIVGLMGFIDRHPLWPNWKLPSWFRGIFIGAWLNFVLVFFAYEKVTMMLQNLDFMGIVSPWWMVLEGAILGLIIDVIATKVGGEGKNLF